MIKAQNMLREANRLQELANDFEDQAEEAQEKARAADFIRVKAEITLADIVKRSLFWKKGPLRNDLSHSIRDLLLKNDDDYDDSSSDEESSAVVLLSPGLSSSSSASLSSSPKKTTTSSSPPVQDFFSHNKSPSKERMSKRRTSKRLARVSSREMIKMSSRNLLQQSRRGLLTRDNSRRVMKDRLINPASKRRLLSVSSRDKSTSKSIREIKKMSSSDDSTLHRFIPQNAPLSMFPEDMSVLDQYTFRDGTLGEGYYHSTFIDPPPRSTSPCPPDDNGGGDDEDKKEEETENATHTACTPKRRWNRAISLLAHVQKLEIKVPHKFVKTEIKKNQLKHNFPAEDFALIEDCLRTALGDARQATRILNVRRQTETGNFSAITVDGEENFVKLMSEDNVVKTLAKFLKEGERKEFTFDPWKCGHPGLSLEEDSMTVIAVGDGSKTTSRSVIATQFFESGRHYWEFFVEHCATGEKSCGTIYFGIAQGDVDLQSPLCREKSIGWYDDSVCDFSKLLEDPLKIKRGTSTGDKRHVGIYLDMDDGEIRFYVDKIEVGRGYLKENGKDGGFGKYFPAVSLYADKTYKGSRIRLDTKAEPPSGILI